MTTSVAGPSANTKYFDENDGIVTKLIADSGKS